jgi:hypothetical protein
MDDEVIEAQEQLFERAGEKLSAFEERDPAAKGVLVELVRDVAGVDLLAQAELVDQLLDHGGER